MNSPESSPTGPSGLQVEFGRKPRSYLRPILLVLLLVLVVGVATVLAWLPNSSSPSFSPTPSATLDAQSSQPKITWSQNHIEVILSPGETSSKDLTFTSDLDVQNITIEPVPELAPFVSVQPTNVASLPAGQPQPVHLAFSIPTDATLGTYDGTIHVRRGSETLPQTVKTRIHVWNLLSDQTAGFEINYPPGWVVSNDEHRYVFSSTGVAAGNEDDVGTDVELFVTPLPSPITIEAWVLRTYGVDLATVDPTEIARGTLSDGTAYMRVVGNIPSGSPETVHVFAITAGRVFTLRSGHEDSFGAQLDLMITSLDII